MTQKRLSSECTSEFYWQFPPKVSFSTTSSLVQHISALNCGRFPTDPCVFRFVWVRLVPQLVPLEAEEVLVCEEVERVARLPNRIFLEPPL